MKRKYVILLHVVFWVLYLANNLWNAVSRGILTAHKSAPINFHLFIKYFAIETGYIIIPVSCFYAACLLAAPQITVKKSYGRAALFTLLTALFIVGYRYVLEYYFFLPVLGFDNYNGNVWPAGRYITNILLFYFPSYFLYGLMYFFITDWYKNRPRQQELEKEKAAAELTFLRSQLNPHFLFNSINDI